MTVINKQKKGGLRMVVGVIGFCCGVLVGVLGPPLVVKLRSMIEKM